MNRQEQPKANGFGGLRLCSDKPLPTAEEHRLARIVRGTSTDGAESRDEARDKLVRANLGIVGLVVKQFENYSKGSVTREDMFQEGVCGLIRAVDKFDPERGFRLESYAVWWIRQAIVSKARAQSNDISAPLGAQQQVSKIEKKVNEVYATSGELLTHEQISQKFGLKGSTTSGYVRAAAAEPASLDTPIFSDSEVLLSDRIPDIGAEPVDEFVGTSINIEKMNLAIESLADPRERKIIRLYSGLRADGLFEDPITLKQIGDALGITRERVRQLKCVAAEKLMAGEYGEFFRALAKDS